MVRAIGVVSQPRRGNIGPCGENSQHLRMQLLAVPLAKCVLEGLTGELMAKSKRSIVVADHADAQTAIDGGFVRSDDLLQKPGLYSSRHQTDELGNLPCSWGESGGARQYSVTHSRRYPVTRGCQRLGYKEGIATGHAMQACNRSSGLACKLSHSGFGKRRQGDPVGAGAGQIANY